MPILYGVCSAIYGGESERRMTTSVVKSPNKEESFVLQSLTSPVNITSIDDLRQKFGGFMQTTVETIRLQQQQSGKAREEAVPVIFGCPLQFPTPQLMAQLRVAFSALLCSKKATRRETKSFRQQCASEAQRTEGYDGNQQDASNAMNLGGKILMHHLQRNGGSERQIDFHPRGIAQLDDRPGKDMFEKIVNDRSLDPEVEEALAFLYSKAEGGDTPALVALENLARDSAITIAMQLTKNNKSQWDTRFFSFGIRKHPYLTSLEQVTEHRVH